MTEKNIGAKELNPKSRIGKAVVAFAENLERWAAEPSIITHREAWSIISLSAVLGAAAINGLLPGPHELNFDIPIWKGGLPKLEGSVSESFLKAVWDRPHGGSESLGTNVVEFAKLVTERGDQQFLNAGFLEQLEKLSTLRGLKDGLFSVLFFAGAGVTFISPFVTRARASNSSHIVPAIAKAVEEIGLNL